MRSKIKLRLLCYSTVLFISPKLNVKTFTHWHKMNSYLFEYLTNFPNITEHWLVRYFHQVRRMAKRLLRTIFKYDSQLRPFAREFFQW